MDDLLGLGYGGNHSVIMDVLCQGIVFVLFMVV